MSFKIARAWIPLAFVATVALFAVYAGAQQTWRMGANQVPVRLAEDGAAALAAGAAPASVATSPAVDVAASLAPWVVVYDRAGRPVAAGATLDGRPAQVPVGVFGNTDASGPHGDRVTWQPRPGVRQAIAVFKVKGGSGGYVAAGQSLREVETQIDTLGLDVLVAWVGALGGSLVLVALFEWMATRRKPAA